MAFYDIELTDIATAQVFRSQFEGRNAKAAEEEAHRRARKLREPPPPGSVYRKNAALKLTMCNRMSMRNARRAFKARMIREGRKQDFLAFRLERHAELKRDHPQWNQQRLGDAIWSKLFSAFPLEPRKPLRPSEAACKSALEEVEKFSAAQLESAEVILLNAALALEDYGGVREDTDWVYHNLMVPWARISVSTVPSPGAIALLEEAKGDKKWFLEKYHAKQVATQAKIDPAGWDESDEGQVVEMRARIVEDMALAEVECG